MTHRLALAFLAHPRGGQAVADALAGEAEYSVVRLAARNLSGVGAHSTLSKGIRGLRSITSLRQDALIEEVEAEFPGGEGPDFRELGEWG